MLMLATYQKVKTQGLMVGISYIFMVKFRYFDGESH